MTEEFNKWWDNDLLTENNPYVDGTPAFWAWEGWCAGVKAKREAIEDLLKEYDMVNSAFARDFRIRHLPTISEQRGTHD